MNGKEAREIVDKSEPKSSPGKVAVNYFWEKGYLEAIEKAERILVKGLKDLIYDAPELSPQSVRDVAKEALAEWEKEK